MKPKKRITVTPGGTPSHMVVWLLNRAERVTANANIRITSETATRAQNSKFSVSFLGSSFDTIG